MDVGIKRALWTLARTLMVLFSSACLKDFNKKIYRADSAVQLETICEEYFKKGKLVQGHSL